LTEIWIESHNPNMRSVGIFEAKNRLSELVSAAESGEVIVLTRNGRPVAELRPIIADKQQAAARIRAMRGLHVRVDEIRGLIDEGRR
jgi:prevent-host-death family protein